MEGALCFEQLWVDGFGELVGFGLRVEVEVVDFLEGWGGVGDVETGVETVLERVAVPFGGFGGPLPVGGAIFGEVDREGDAGGLVGFEGDDASFAAVVGVVVAVLDGADEAEGAISTLR